MTTDKYTPIKGITNISAVNFTNWGPNIAGTKPTAIK